MKREFFFHFNGMHVNNLFLLRSHLFVLTLSRSRLRSGRTKYKSIDRFRFAFLQNATSLNFESRGEISDKGGKQMIPFSHECFPLTHWAMMQTSVIPGSLFFSVSMQERMSLTLTITSSIWRDTPNSATTASLTSSSTTNIVTRDCPITCVGLKIFLGSDLLFFGRGTHSSSRVYLLSGFLFTWIREFSIYLPISSSCSKVMLVFPPDVKNNVKALTHVFLSLFSSNIFVKNHPF